MNHATDAVLSSPECEEGRVYSSVWAGGVHDRDKARWHLGDEWNVVNWSTVDGQPALAEHGTTGEQRPFFTRSESIYLALMHAVAHCIASCDTDAADTALVSTLRLCYRLCVPSLTRFGEDDDDLAYLHFQRLVVASAHAVCRLHADRPARWPRYPDVRSIACFRSESLLDEWRVYHDSDISRLLQHRARSLVSGDNPFWARVPCCICLTDDMTHADGRSSLVVFHPCGHSMCRSPCRERHATSSRGRECPMCRGLIYRVMPIDRLHAAKPSYHELTGMDTLSRHLHSAELDLRPIIPSRSTALQEPDFIARICSLLDLRDCCVTSRVARSWQRVVDDDPRLFREVDLTQRSLSVGDFRSVLRRARGRMLFLVVAGFTTANEVLPGVAHHTLDRVVVYADHTPEPYVSWLLGQALKGPHELGWLHLPAAAPSAPLRLYTRMLSAAAPAAAPLLAYWHDKLTRCRRDHNGRLIAAM